MNARRGIRRICVALTAVWIPLALLYPFYLRKQRDVVVREKVGGFHELCVDDVKGPYDEAVRERDEAGRWLDEVNVVGAQHATALRALHAFLEADRSVDEAKARRDLGIKRCSDARNKLYKEVFPSELNSYQWFARPRTGRIWLLGDPHTPQNEHLIEYLAADLNMEKLELALQPRLPASIVFPAALILPPVLLYFLLTGVVALMSWIIRGFKAAEPPRAPS